MTTAWRGIESRLGELVAMRVVDEGSARQALAELMSTVAQINEPARGVRLDRRRTHT